MTKRLIEVTPGEVRVNSIVCRYDEPDFAAWEIDCSTKYARVMVGGGDEGVSLLLLFADENTRRKDESTDQATVISFPLPGNDWTILVDGGRYSFYIAAYRRQEGEIVWHKDDHSRDPGTEGPDG